MSDLGWLATDVGEKEDENDEDFAEDDKDGLVPYESDSTLTFTGSLVAEESAARKWRYLIMLEKTGVENMI